MIEKKITTNDKQYIIKINNDNLKKEVNNNQTRWTVKHEIWEEGRKQIGHGHLRTSCQQEHGHISDEEMLNIIINIGATNIKEDIDAGNDIESKGYNFNITDCTK